LQLPEDTIAFSYDALGRLLSADDGDSNLTFSYDLLGRLVESTAAALALPATTYSKSYDAAGQVESLSDGLGFDLAYSHDEIGNLSSITLPDLSQIVFGYDGNGREISTGFPGGLEAARSYDLGGNLAALTYRVGTAEFLSFERSYDGLGRLSTENESSLVTNYQYDPIFQLLSETSPGFANSYDYDAEGNPTATPRSQASVIDDANRILEDDLFSYSYDLNGNMISKTEKTGGLTTSFSYDSLDRLVAVSLPDGRALSYRYDALGRRIERNIEGAIERYRYDGDNLVQQFDGAGNLSANFVHGQGQDRILVQLQGTEVINYITDVLGSVRILTDVSGQILNQYDYDSFGQPIQELETRANLIRFAGRPWEAALGLSDLRARWYDPALGRFLSQDPLGFGSGSSNLYSYVFNSPVNYRDPDGRQTATPLPSPLGPPIPLPDIFIPGTPGNDKFVADTLDALDALSEAIGEAANDNEPPGQVVPFPEEAVANNEQAGNRHDSSTIFPRMPQLCRRIIDQGLYCAWICPDGELIERTKGLTCPSGPCALLKLKTW
jgi:RHS repeat-associated protein